MNKEFLFVLFLFYTGKSTNVDLLLMYLWIINEYLSKWMLLYAKQYVFIVAFLKIPVGTHINIFSSHTYDIISER